ncbi:hypothetical protein [Haliscomenobacter sp.]|uniref:hypothetical protein n=1 Tax=Haliscomenobacter sp. TaxID=2717303 RepID=UPI0033651E19
MVDTTFSIEAITLNYLTDEEGKKTSVIIPIEDWIELKKTLTYIALKEDLLQAFQEMHEIKKGTQPRLSLNDVINEL